MIEQFEFIKNLTQTPDVIINLKVIHTIIYLYNNYYDLQGHPYDYLPRDLMYIIYIYLLVSQMCVYIVKQVVSFRKGLVN